MLGKTGSYASAKRAGRLVKRERRWPSAGQRTQRRCLKLEQLEQRTLLSASIAGQVFRGLVAINPPSQPAEPGVPGVTVFLDANQDGIRQPSETQMQTDSNGDYTFSNLAPGTHAVAIELPAGEWGYINRNSTRSTARGA